MSETCKHGINKINVCTDCLKEKFGQRESELAPVIGSADETLNNLRTFLSSSGIEARENERRAAREGRYVDANNWCVRAEVWETIKRQIG